MLIQFESKDRLVGWIICCFTGLIIAFGNVFYKLAYLRDDGMGVFQALALRNFTTGFIAVVSLIYKSRAEGMYKKEDFFHKGTLWYSFIHAVAIGFAYQVLTFTSVGNWTSLLGIGFILTVPGAAIFLNQPIKLIHGICVFISFVGAILIVKPDIFFSGESKSFTMTQILMMIGFIISVGGEFLSYGFVDGPIPVILSVDSLFCLIINSIICFAFGLWESCGLIPIIYVCIWGSAIISVLALQFMAGARLTMVEISVIRAFDKIWAYIVAFILLGENVSWNSYAGSAIILLALVTMALTKSTKVHVQETGETCEETNETVEISTNKGVAI